MFCRRFPSMKTSQRVRAHYLLEQQFNNESKGPERLRRYYEELNGNRLLDENSTFALLGRMHSKMRELFGRMGVSFGRRWSEDENGS